MSIAMQVDLLQPIVLQVKSVRQREVLYCLHESGSVSAKFRRKQLAFVGSPLDAPAGSVSSVGRFSCREALYRSLNECHMKLQCADSFVINNTILVMG
jgi:hypothetical protein